jgi:excisionase family DNA binding protein
MSIPTETPWLTSREAASYLRVEPRTILLWAKQGKVKGYALSGTIRQTWRFLRADLDAMLTAPSAALLNREELK